jgi:cell division protease FtsH
MIDGAYPMSPIHSAYTVLRPITPLLEHLHGMNEACEFGEEVARDLKDWKAGLIKWSEVDKGALLHGPPGTGKTTFALALAATCGIPIIITSYARLQRTRDGHLGDVLAAMAAVFEHARRIAPCIVFFDEIEAVGSREGGGQHQRWYTAIITALNEHLDGSEGREGVVVIAAANFPERIDPALVRPGRLDTSIAIPMPNARQLEGIIRFHLRDDLPNCKLAGLAVACQGMTGADVEMAVRKARRRARRFGRALRLADLDAVLSERWRQLPRQFLDRIAVHEAGHATAAVVFKVSRHVSVSLLAQGDSSPATYFDPVKEPLTRKVVIRRIAVALAGRAAEQVLLGDVTAGATSDLALANSLACSAVARWGLSETGPLRYFEGPAEQLFAKHPELAEEARAMLQAAYNSALALMRRRKAQVRAIANALLVRRGLTHDEIVALLARRRLATSGRRKQS